MLEPLGFVVVAMHHVPGRPSPVIVSRIADEFRRHKASMGPILARLRQADAPTEARGILFNLSASIV
jgi:hypothetical protein